MDVQFDLSERRDEGSQVVERQEAAIELLVQHQRFAKPIESTLRHLYSPVPCLFLGRTFELNGFLSPAFDVLLNDLQSGCPRYSLHRRISACLA